MIIIKKKFRVINNNNIQLKHFISLLFHYQFLFFFPYIKYT